MMTTNSTPSRFWFGFFAGVVTAVILAGVLAVLFHHPPFLSEGTSALIRIHSEPQTFIFEDKEKNLDEGKYRMKVYTQIAIMRSPVVIEKVLETTEVADLPVIKRQKDALQFILRYLKIEPIRNSEIISVSMPRLPNSEAAVIINALVHTYFDYTELSEQDTSSSLIRQLNAEMARQTAVVQLYQSSIRDKTAQINARTVKISEAILAYEQARTKLGVMQTEETRIKQHLSEAAQKGEPTGEIEKSLNDIQATIENQTKTVNDCRSASLSASNNTAELELNKVDTAFDEANLQRVNKILDALSDRLVRLQAERYAPTSIQLLRLAKTDK